MSLLGDAAGALTGNVGLYVVGGLILAGAAAVGTQTWRLHSLETDFAEARAGWAQRETDLAQQVADAEHRERAKEQAWNARQQEIVDVANQKVAAADSAASAAVSARDRLLDRVQAAAAAARRSRANPSAPSDGQAAPDAIGVLADVLGRADAAAGFMAAVADQRGIRGEACERAYESLRK